MTVLESGTSSNALPFTITEVPLSATGAYTVNAIEGQLIENATVATFTAPSTAEYLGEYMASIDWGDGSASTGTILGPDRNGLFTVTGSHTYAEDAPSESDVVDNLPITVTLSHETVPSVMVLETAYLGEATLSATGGLTLNAAEGQAITDIAVATFSGGASQANACSATIDWGDGTTSLGTIAGPNQGVFTVLGNHTYIEDGDDEVDAVDSFSISVTIRCAIQASPAYNYTSFDVQDPSYPFGFTAATGINDAGQIAGYYYDASGSHGYLLSGGSLTTFDVPGLNVLAWGINNSGQIVGQGFGERLAFLYSGGNITSFRVPNSYRTNAYGINNLGQIVGSYVDAALGGHGFLLSDGSYTSIDMPGETDFILYGINDAGQIVGWGTNSGGFLLSAGVHTQIQVPGPFFTEAQGINNLGQIVGSYLEGNTAHGFLLSGGSYTTLDVPGSTGTQVFGINNAGEIVGLYRAADGYSYHAFLATPVGGSILVTDTVDVSEETPPSGGAVPPSTWFGRHAIFAAPPVLFAQSSSQVRTFGDEPTLSNLSGKGATVPAQWSMPVWSEEANRLDDPWQFRHLHHQERFTDPNGWVADRLALALQGSDLEATPAAPRREP